ncbi:MAG TPA: NAD(P)-dependent alcohol dehydrogenase [Rhizomicrobium sp.]|nr:NAD(P)-dependent alcohol dehydrogenase [Rhizomicrobium sp.]
MKIYEVVKGARNLDGLRLAERPDPKPGRRQVLVRVRAVSLNYRDLAVVQGVYPGPPMSGNVIPLSDGAGEVIGVGEEVTRFRPGDRVVGTFFQVWIDGRPPPGTVALGASPVDGMLAEQVALHEDGLVAIPEGLSFEEAATLPCAGVTAWHGLMVAGKSITPGQSVLVLGTGGVSMFALQFGRAAGARVIVTSSHDEKLERARALGASATVNYKRIPEWGKAVQELTGGAGVDCVIEVGGTGTLANSFQAVGFGGKVSLIGVLSGFQGDTSPHSLMFKNASLHGIFVGNRRMFEDMLAAMRVNAIKPVIDRTFAFKEVAEAYRYQMEGRHFGKVVIRF